MSSSLGRNSLIMAAGTAASRVTGQVRTILLAAALGTTGIAANAYQAGSMIPQAVFALISGGIFNAVLVPQIVRTLQQKDAEERLNKLITLAIALLALVTVVMAAATPLLTMLYVAGTPEMLALTNAFTLWCMPQIFFYGLYTVIGQVLAAKDHFGAYAWSSVGANVISCAGFTAFILMFGRATEQPIDFWTGDKLLLTAGTWTIGVAFQALILFLPLTRCGIRYRPRWGIHGIGLRSMGSVAGWSVAIVVVDQLVNLLTTRITTSAPGAAHARLGLDMVEVAGNATYQNAFTLYMLPYSLIAVSVATALFPRISRAIADSRIDDARATLSQALRSIGVLMLFFTVAFIVMPVPIIIALLPSVSMHEASLIAAPLMMLGIGLPISSAYLIIQRTFYSFEDGKHPFLFMLLFNLFFIAFVFGASLIAAPTQWVMYVGAGSAVGHLLAFPFLIQPLRSRFGGRLDGHRILNAYAKAAIAAAVAAVLGLLAHGPVYALLGIWTSADVAEAGSRDAIAANHGHPAAQADAMSMNWLQAVGACVLLTIVITVAYVGVLWLLRSRELMMAVDMVAARLKARSGEPTTDVNAGADVNAAVSGTDGDGEEGPGRSDHTDGPDQPDLPNASGSGQTIPVPKPPKNRAQSTDIPLPPAPPQPFASTTPTARMTPKPSSVPSQYGVGMKPQLGDTIINRYTLVSPLRNTPGLQAWKANDRMLAQDCQVFVVTDRRAVAQVNDITSVLASMHDQRLTQVLQLHHSGDLPIVVTREDAGLSLSDYLRGPARKILSHAAIRSILGETTTIVRMLLSRGVVDHAISTDTVRISAAGVQLADIPVSMMLQDVSGRVDESMGAEERAVRQLAALLFSLLAGTPSSAHAEYDMSRLSDDIPGEFKLICRRGLGLHGAADAFTAPMSSLAEIDALLGTWSPLNQLMEHDIALPSIAGTPSIVLASIVPTPQNALMEIPAGMVNTNPLPPLSLTTPKYASALTSDDVVDVTPLTGDLFSAFDGQNRTDGNGAALPTVPLNVSSVRNSDGTMPTQVIPNAPGFSFPVSAPVADPVLKSDGEQAAAPVVSVAGNAGDAAEAAKNDIEATQALPTAVAPPTVPPPVSDPALEATQIIEPVGGAATPDPGATAAMPPVSVKTAVTRPDKIANAAVDADVADETLMIGLPTKIITVIVGVAVVLGAGFFAIRSLNNAATGNVGGDSSSQSDPWSQDNLDDVPFGDESSSNGDGDSSSNGDSSNSSGSSSSSGSSDNASKNSSSKDSSNTSSDKKKSDSSSTDSKKSTVVTKDKESKKVPDPKYENNTPLTISSQSFLSSPAGQSGFAYHLHFNESTKVYRMKITITTSGGKAYVRTGTSDDPTKGKQVAEFSFAEGGTTEVKFNSVVDTQDVMIWVPMDSLPNNQLYIQKVELF